MLYFYCADAHDVKSFRGAHASGSGASYVLLDTLEDAEAQCTNRILVVDAGDLDGAEIPVEAVLNADPYAPPKRITAAGGFVTRRHGGALQLLLIFRRGTWDLPKGKRDKGESVDECALREVREELGIDDVNLGQPLGTTVHAYLQKSHCMIKTTHWFEMSTRADTFNPQAEEDIEAVSWMSWRRAREQIGFETLRRHMDEVERLL